jgi:hypothetical protein
VFVKGVFITFKRFESTWHNRILSSSGGRIDSNPAKNLKSVIVYGCCLFKLGAWLLNWLRWRAEPNEAGDEVAHFAVPAWWLRLGLGLGLGFGVGLGSMEAPGGAVAMRGLDQLSAVGMGMSADEIQGAI